MKKKNCFYLLLISAVVVIAVASIFVFGNKKVDYEELTEVRLGCAAGLPYNGTEFRLTLQDGTWVAYRNRFVEAKGELVEDIKEQALDEETVQAFKKILSDNKLHKWDGFNESMQIMDGYGFSFYMCFSDGSEVNAQGYMKFPENYKEVLAAIIEQYDLLFGPIQYEPSM